MISKKLKILIIGPQGSGKTTQSKLLSEYLRIPFIETGETLRDLAKKDTEEGERVKELLDRGEMVPNDIVARFIKTRINEKDCGRGYVINGYPRNLNQIKLFDPGFDKVFYLEIKDKLVLERLLKRGREDDTKELIEKRLSDYHTQTVPILEYYEDLGILENVDGTSTIDNIQDEIRRRLDG